MAGLLIEPVVKIPALIQQGDSISWIDEPFTDDQGNLYQAANYSLVYTIAGAAALLTLTGVATGTGWTTSATTAQTSALTPGTSWWQATLTASNFALTVARGELTVVVNLTLQSAGYSGYSQAEQNLMAAQTQLASASATESYKVGTREMRYRMIKDILDTISYWNAVVVSEKTANSIAQNQGNPRKLYARFPSRFGTRE
jgi:hypothetical protein